MTVSMRSRFTPRRASALALLSALVLGACAAPITSVDDRTPRSGTDAATAFDHDFVPPWGLVTERMRLEPLRPAVAELDYNGFMSSIDHLQAALHWGWPTEDFELEQNVGDMERHWAEFGNGEAYAYTVLAPDRSRCIGCVYVNPLDGRPRSANVAYWITADVLDARLDEHLLSELVAWFERDWPLDQALFPTHREYARGFDVARAAGLNDPQGIEAAEGDSESSEQPERVAMYWSREGFGPR